MIKKNWILLLFTLSVITFVINRYTLNRDTDAATAAQITAVTFPSGNGWGYDILKEGSVYIHQTNIPAVSGNKTFSSAAEAMKIAGLMIKKMSHSSKLPDVSLRELDSCGIRY